MKNYWASRVPVEETIRMFLRRAAMPVQGKIAKAGRKIYEGPNLGEALLLWKNSPNEFSPPAVIVTNRQDFHAILPKILAIPGAVSSTTSFSRFWTDDEAIVFFKREPEPIVSHCVAGLTGLIICELMLRLGEKADIRRIGMGVVARTFSYVCASLISKGGQLNEIVDLRDAWIQASTITGNDVNKEQLQIISEFCRFIEFLFGPYSSFDGTSFSLARLIDEKVNAEIVGAEDVPLVVRLEKLKGATREQRFSEIESAIKSILSGMPDQSFNSSLCCGFLLTQLDVGSTEFFDFARTVGANGAAIPFAYLMCSGLLNGSDFLWKSDGLGIEIAKALRAGNTERLNACPDLTLAELKILRAKITDEGFNFRTKHPSEVEVELIADVTGTFSNGIRRNAVEHRFGANDIEIDKIRQVQSRLKRLANLSLLMHDEVAQLSEGLNEGREKSRRNWRG